MLDQLEELNLDGVRTVPDVYEPALAELRDQLEGLARVRPRLIETIFTIQEIICPPRLDKGALPVDEPPMSA